MILLCDAPYNSLSSYTYPSVAKEFFSHAFLVTEELKGESTVNLCFAVFKRFTPTSFHILWYSHGFRDQLLISITMSTKSHISGGDAHCVLSIGSLRQAQMVPRLSSKLPILPIEKRVKERRYFFPTIHTV